MRNNIQKFSLSGMLIALGIVYGDIGTSPLYVLKAIMSNYKLTEQLILGSISCIVWTLTLQTTLKYIVLILRADNKGEGGIFSLYALVRPFAKIALLPATVGAVALLADGVMTPAVTITASVEGLTALPFFSDNKVLILVTVIVIISAIFFAQQFGTERVGSLFGPIMMVWFLFLAIVGIGGIAGNWRILAALNPYYAYDLLHSQPHNALFILGAVFLCTTGAEALYSDLGHCGSRNIRVSWGYVKLCLILNYLGQGAHLLSYTGEKIHFNPFFAIVPSWFLLGSVGLATLAAIIASQALISGSFSLISQAMRLDLWPRMRIVYPTHIKGQLYIPALNTILYIGCLVMVLIFRESSNMEAAYGLSIVISMLMTSVLFVLYMLQRRVHWLFVGLYILVYSSIELSFLLANMQKFFSGAYMAFLLGSLFFLISYAWRFSRRIKKDLYKNVNLVPYLPILQKLSKDESIPKFATHLIYLNNPKRSSYVQSSVMHSLLAHRPKRADVYWFVRLITTDNPSTLEYSLIPLLKGNVYIVKLYLGFQVHMQLDKFVQSIISNTIKEDNIPIALGYDFEVTKNPIGDYKFIYVDETLGYDSQLGVYSRIIIRISAITQKLVLSTGGKSFGINPNKIMVETYPTTQPSAEGPAIRQVNE